MFLSVAMFVLLLKMLFGGIRISFTVKLITNCCDIELGMQVLRKCKLSLLRLRVEWSAEDGALLLHMKKHGEAKLLAEIGKSGKRKHHDMVKYLFGESDRWLKLESLRAEGCIGIREDAFACVVLTGALDYALGFSFKLLLNNADPPDVTIRPNFSVDLFRLNLAGIFRIHTVQIIITAFKWYFPKRGFGNYVASHREHYENDYGTN